MQLALRGNDGLVQLAVDAGLERRVLLVQRGEAGGELVLVAARVELERRLGVGLGIFDLGQHDDVPGVAQRVAGVGVPEFHGGADVAGGEHVDGGAGLAVETEELADALGDPAVAVVEIHAGVHVAGIDAENREVAAQRVRQRLEGERHRLLAGQADLAGLVRRVSRGDGGAVDGRRAEARDEIEQPRHADVGLRRRCRTAG